ncbi:MAG: type II secretion system protein [Candidatus Paceibacterota bacterium]|jgi:type II secretion system protein G
MKKINKRGFTLIELLVVIAIIGILSSVVLVSLNSSRAKARDAKRIADISQLQTALALYMDTNGTYPAAIADLAPNYVPVEPKDPTSSASYSYAPLSSALSYHLGTTLEQSTNSVLSTDKDQAKSSETGDFDGTSCGASSATTDVCYDVTP